MPLSQNDPTLDYDGSWDVASRKWPYLLFSSETDAERATKISWKECKIPYGSFVTVGNYLRLETEEMREQVWLKLSEIGIKAGFGDVLS